MIFNETQIKIKINTLERRIKEINEKNKTTKSILESDVNKLLITKKYGVHSKKQKIIKNWTEMYFPNNIFDSEIGFVIKISIVPLEVSSEKVRMQTEGIIISSNQGDISKNEFMSIKSTFMKL